MGKINPPDESIWIDYRYGGETWDSLVLKLMECLPHIYTVLNALNGTDDSGYVLPEPETGSKGVVVRKNADGTVSINITGNAATADKLKTSRTITLTGNASGTAVFDGSQDVEINVSGVSGNAVKIANRPVDGANIADGTILVYRADGNKFVLETKGTVGSGKTLKVLFGDEVLGKYNGDLAETIDLKPLIQEVMANVITQFERRNLLEIDEEGNLSPKASYDPLDIRALIDRCMLFTTDDEGNIIPKEGR